MKSVIAICVLALLAAAPARAQSDPDWSAPVAPFRIAGNVLVGNRSYPDIVRDYERSFDRVAAMKADIVLSNHPDIADVLGREARVRAGQTSAFVDPKLLGRIVADARKAFTVELKKQTVRRRR